jgi:UDP-N-acetylglucosamine diphosphorylase/glucosamine-1-phosphate N-acetyltransferase
MKQAVILAAGEGQRLRPFTVTRPKVMLSIGGKPILEYVIEALAQNGIRRIVVVVGYRKEQIFDHFGNGGQLGVEIVYLTQDRQLGTAHALAQARNVVEKEFLVLGGDNLIDAETIAGFVSADPPAMLLKQAADARRYGVVMVDGSTVTGIIEKPENHQGDRVNTGIYAFRDDVFDFIGHELDIPDVINVMLDRNCPVGAFETQGTWLDVVYPWDLVRLNGAILARTAPRLGGTVEGGVTLKGAVSVGADTIIRSGSYIVGPVVIGENCEIGPNVCILPSTSIGDNVSVSPFTTIENSVVGDDVSIGPASIVEDSVIDKGSVIRGHFTASSGEAVVQVDEEHHRVNVGAMVGIGCSLGSNLVAEPGSIVGNYCQVQPMKVIRGTFQDRTRIF